MEKSVKSWGYVNQRDFKDPAIDKLTEKLHDPEASDEPIKITSHLLKKIRDNESLLTFSEQLTTDNRVRELTKGFKSHCDNAHPSYKNGYNPRHYNYLKSSSKLTSGCQE